MSFIKRRRLALAFTALFAVGAVWLAGCGGGGNNSSGGDDPSHVHEWGDWTVTVPATCDAPGVEKRTCTLDARHTDTQAIPMLTGADCESQRGSATLSGDILTDVDDGQTYKTAVIDGKRWMAKNLNFEPSSGGNWCYGDNAGNCDTYGRLYDWETAKKACPSGWRLPSKDDWDGLVSYAGGKYTAGSILKSTSGWKNREDGSGGGTDALMFSALPGGYRNANGGFDFIGEFGYWWTATVEAANGFAYSRNMLYNYDDVEEHGSTDRSGFSVRCVKN